MISERLVVADFNQRGFRMHAFGNQRISAPKTPGEFAWAGKVAWAELLALYKRNLPEAGAIRGFASDPGPRCEGPGVPASRLRAALAA